MGSYVRRFEELVAESARAANAVAVSSGTAALHATLLALGVRPGDRVVVPACSYIATANAVRYCGAEPVFVDVRPDTWTLNERLACEAVRRDRAVGAIAVHLFGVPCDVAELYKQMPAGCFVLEDSCEAHGVPLQSDAAVFSFYGNKIVTTGEGGAVVTNAPDLAAKVRLLRGQGTSGAARYVHETLGYNYRMTELQAAIGCGQLELLATHLRKRMKLRRAYDRLLPRAVLRQGRLDGSVDWVVPIRLAERDAVARSLQEVGIETRPVFPALHQQPIYRMHGGAFPIAEQLAREGLLLPLHLGMGESDVAEVCTALETALEAAA
jgi:perosamine synthetase